MPSLPPVPSVAFLSRTVVLIPASNEASAIPSTVEYWRPLGVLEVLVVDNGSVDDTAMRARAAGARVVSEPQKGYGAAAWTGLQHLPPDALWVLFISADNSDQFHPSELPAWQAAVEAGADLVLGDRTHHPHARRQLRVAQRVGSWIFRTVVHLAWGHRFQDMGSRRLLRVESIPRLDLRDRAFGWNVEMQVRALEAGLRIVELPAHFQPRQLGTSKISGNFLGTVRASLGILATLAQLARTRARRRPLTTGRSSPP